MGVHIRMQSENSPEISGDPFSGKFDGAFLHSPDPAETWGDFRKISSSRVQTLRIKRFPGLGELLDIQTNFPVMQGTAYEISAVAEIKNGIFSPRKNGFPEEVFWKSGISGNHIPV